MELNIVCIPGDGIGPEIVAEVKKFWKRLLKNIIITFPIKIF